MAQNITYTGAYNDYSDYNARRRAGRLGDDAQFFNIPAYAGSPNGLKNWFSNAKAKGSGMFNTFTNPNNYSWSKSGGLSALGKNVGKWGTVAGGAMYGLDALQGLKAYQDTVSDNEDLETKIRLAAMGNPIHSSFLTAEQRNLLGDIQNNAYNSGADSNAFAEGAVGGVGDAILPALLGFAVGGVPGALVGGIGSLANSGIDNLSESSAQNTAELQALYQALQDADAQYRSMKRPNFTGLGIQQRYQDMYM